jgi:anti-sigma factor RsiW
MNCVDIESKFDLLIDHEADNETSELIEEHLAECPRCQNAFEKLNNLSTAIRVMPIGAPSKLVKDRVMKALKPSHVTLSVERVSPGWSVRIPAPALALAAVAFIACLGLSFQAGRMSAPAGAFTIENTSAKPESARESRVQSTLVHKSPELEDSASSSSTAALHVVTKINKEPLVTQRPVTKYLAVEEKRAANIAQRVNNKNNNFRKTKNERDEVNTDHKPTQIDLVKFAPVAEIRATIIKGDKINEK